MSDSQKSYWSFFNIIGRLVGACFALVGVIFVIYGVAAGGALYAVPGLVVGVLGILMCIAKPIDPNNDDSAPSNKV